MDVIISHAQSIRGTVSVPADKAICHRAAFLSAVSQGATEIAPWASSEDCQHTLNILQQLGVDICAATGGIRIEGNGLMGLATPRQELYCGDSGTTMRLAAGLLAGQPFMSRLMAGSSLRLRPMRRVVEPLSQMGAKIAACAMAPREGNPPEDYPPLQIQGKRPLSAITYTMPVASAQVKSAILLASLYANGPTTVVEPIQTRDHTERLLERLGVSIHRVGQTIVVDPPRASIAAPGHLSIPGDLSSAAFFIVAAAVLPGSRLVVQDVGLNPTRMGFLEVLKRMGASIDWQAQGDDWEPLGTVRVEHRPLNGTVIEAHEVGLLIDELPILMVAACAAEGRTRFEGLEELRVKETDRLHSMTTGLTSMGARIVIEGSDLVVGQGQLVGSTVDSFHDHRTAMGLAIAGLLAQGQTRIRDCGCVAKSFGNFFELLSSMVGCALVNMVDS